MRCGASGWRGPVWRRREGCDAFLRGLSEAEQQESDEGDGDLDTHRVLGGAEEAGDFEGLLDPAEEQLDGPAALIEVGDLLGGGIEVVREDAQHLAGLDLDAGLRGPGLEGIAAASAWRAGRWPMRSERMVLPWARQFHQGERRVGLEAGDDAAAFGVKLGPPAIIVIAQVEDIGGAGLDGHGLGGGDVVDVRRADRGIDRPIGVRIIDDMHLRTAHAGGEARPITELFSRTAVELIRYVVSATLRRSPRWACFTIRANNSVNTSLGRTAFASASVER